MNSWPIAAVALAAAAGICRLVTWWALRNPPQGLVRRNVDGRAVPAVLGWGVVAGVVVGHLVWAAEDLLQQRTRECAVRPGPGCADFLLFDAYFFVGLVFLTVGMFGVGLWDDLKGDERPRGFSGHLASLRGGAFTGGMMKLIGGGTTALVAVAVMGEFGTLYGSALVALCVALSANLLNLFDRAPGRASKVFLLVAIPLALLDTGRVFLLLAGPIGAVVTSLPFDLKARGMLGDAAANPLGALLGLGLASTSYRSGWGFATVGIVLLGLNLASEKWSFSEVIAKNRVLARLDHLGRE